MVMLLVLGLALLVSTTSSNYCEGDMIWRSPASICISTCPQRYHYQECPSRTIGRCVCPDHKPVLKEETGTTCVEASSCPEPDWYKITPSGLADFKFTKEPQNTVETVGRSVTLSCEVKARRPVQYFWYKMDKLPSGDMTSNDNLYIAGTSKLEFKSLKVSDMGYYQCKARSQDGYSLLSSVSKITIKHVSFEDTVKSTERAVENKGLVKLKCNKATASYPEATIQWTKNGEAVKEADIFMNSKKDSEEYGYLYMLNVKNSHAGKYKCIASVNDEDVGGTFVLSEIDLKIGGTQNHVADSPVIMKEATYGAFVELKGTAVLYCAGYGYPPPSYRWAKGTEASQRLTGCGEKYCVQDHGRELVIQRVEESDYGGYLCQVSNTESFTSQVLEMTRKPSSYDIKFEDISKPKIITPNRYLPFNLTCSVNIVSSDRVFIGWYKDGKSLDGGNRIETEDSVTDNIRIRKLVFKYPTDNDPGLYQCLAYNTEEFVQASTQITLNDADEKDEVVSEEMWIPESPYELKLYTQPKGIEEAHAACKAWKTGADIVSILDHEQNDEIFRLLQANNITKAWIGLTDEVRQGMWVWFTGELSTKYSNWMYNEPDNGAATGSNDYVIMNVAKAGQWEDETKVDKVHPYVCKYYNATCPLLSEDANYNEYTVANYNKIGQSIRVFDKAVISCKNGMRATLTCGSNGKWLFPMKSQCEPQAAIGAASTHTLAHSLLLILLLLVLR